MAAGAAAIGASGCEGPRVGEALDQVGGNAGVSSAGSNSGGPGSGGNASGNGGNGGSSAGASAVGGEAGEPGAAGSGACTGDGASTRGPELVCIPGGTFSMGTEVLQGLIATPIHPETVASFYMDKTEVTLGQYMQCMDDAPELCTPPDDYNVDFQLFCYFPDTTRAEYPANCIDWYQAKAFCEWADKRLPTEIEYEYSVRGTVNRTYPWGSAAPAEQLCWSGTATTGPCPVGSFPAGDTPEGLEDLAGSVWEMTASYYCTYTDQGIGPPCDQNTVIRRGGSFWSNATYHANAGFREELVPSRRSPEVGFRCAR